MKRLTSDQKYAMSGNRISVRTLDLNMDFEKLGKKVLDVVLALGYAVAVCWGVWWVMKIL